MSSVLKMCGKMFWNHSTQYVLFTIFHITVYTCILFCFSARTMHVYYHKGLKYDVQVMTKLHCSFGRNLLKAFTFYQIIAKNIWGKSKWYATYKYSFSNDSNSMVSVVLDRQVACATLIIRPSLIWFTETYKMNWLYGNKSFVDLVRKVTRTRIGTRTFTIYNKM